MKRAVLLLLVAVSAGFYVYRNWVVAAPFIDASPSDFSHYHEAARAIAAGKSPYTVHNFDYPPLTALVVLPLARFDYAGARWIWFLAGQAAVVLAALAAWLALGRGLGALAAVAAAWGLCGTTAENLVLGQVAPLILLLLAAALLRGRTPAIALAAALKIFPGVILFGDLLARRWKTLATAAVALLLFVALPLAFLAPLDGPDVPASSGYWMGTPALLNVSIPALAWRVLERPRGEQLPDNWIHGNNTRSLRPHAAGRAASVTAAALVLLAGTIVMARRRGPASDPVHECGAWLTLAILASPIAWYHYALLLFPFLAALALDLARDRRFGGLVALTAAAAALTWSHRFAIAPYLEAYGWTAKEPLLLYGATALPAAAGVALFAMLVWRMETGLRIED